MWLNGIVLVTILFCGLIGAGLSDFLSINSFLGFVVGLVVGALGSIYIFGFFITVSNINTELSELNTKFGRLLSEYSNNYKNANIKYDANQENEEKGNTIKFHCPCGFSTFVDKKMSGKTAKCPKCGQTKII